jgi:hypothetical protein
MSRNRPGWISARPQRRLIRKYPPAGSSGARRGLSRPAAPAPSRVPQSPRSETRNPLIWRRPALGNGDAEMQLGQRPNPLIPPSDGFALRGFAASLFRRQTFSAHRRRRRSSTRAASHLESRDRQIPRPLNDRDCRAFRCGMHVRHARSRLRSRITAAPYRVRARFRERANAPLSADRKMACRRTRDRMQLDDSRTRHIDLTTERHRTIY